MLVCNVMMVGLLVSLLSVETVELFPEITFNLLINEHERSTAENVSHFNVKTRIVS